MLRSAQGGSGTLAEWSADSDHAGSRPRDGSDRNDTLTTGLTARLREVCKGRRVAEVARLTGWREETARRYLLGRNVPSPIFLGRLVEELGVSGTWLLTGAGERLG